MQFLPLKCGLYLMTVTCFERREYSKSDGTSLPRSGSKKTIASTLLVHTPSRSFHFLSLIQKTAMYPVDNLMWQGTDVASCNGQQRSEAFSPNFLRMWGMPRASLGSLEMERVSRESRVDCSPCHYPIAAWGRPQSKGSWNLFPDC